MRSTASLWNQRAEAPRLPSVHEDLRVDVAVVGGGITGVTSALLLAEAGKRVALLESRAIGAGITGCSTAHVTEALDTRYVELERYGAEHAKLVRRSSREAIERVAELAARCGDHVGFRRVPGYLFSEDVAELASLQDEAAAAQRAGATAELSPVPLGIAKSPGVRFADQAEIDPRAYVLALAELAQRAGAQLFEGSLVVDVRAGEPSRLETERGPTVLADDVILATHSPFTKVLFQTKISQYRSYVVAGPVETPREGLFWDTADPYHYVRSARLGENTYLIVGGEDHKTGHVPEGGYEAAYERLEAFARRVGCEPELRWSAQVVEPVDGLPYIGRPTRDERIYVATGFSGNGITLGTISAMILHDQILGRQNPYSEIYRANRLKPIASLPPLVGENVDFPLQLLRDRLHGGSREAPTRLAPGEARILEIDGERLAVYRDETNQVHAVSAFCTHMGCQVAFNPLERSWDCPCHGSRFGLDGTVLDGPATKPLAKRLL